MKYKLINITALFLVIILLTPSVTLLVGSDFSKAYAQEIDEEKAVKGLVISGLLVFMIEKIMDGSSNESNNYRNSETEISIDNDNKVY